jgi:hypothetical protein
MMANAAPVAVLDSLIVAAFNASSMPVLYHLGAAFVSPEFARRVLQRPHVQLLELLLGKKW